MLSVSSLGYNQFITAKRVCKGLVSDHIFAGRQCSCFIMAVPIVHTCLI